MATSKENSYDELNKKLDSRERSYQQTKEVMLRKEQSGVRRERWPSEHIAHLKWMVEKTENITEEWKCIILTAGWPSTAYRS